MRTSKREFGILGEFNTRLDSFFGCRMQVVGLIRQVVDQTFPAVPVKQRAYAVAAGAD